MEYKRLGAAAIILNGAGDVLLVKLGYGPLNWELPGGGAEAGESIVETALREVREETGLRVIAKRTSGVCYDTATDMLHFAFLQPSVVKKFTLVFDAPKCERPGAQGSGGRVWLWTGCGHQGADGE
ncbi:MAG TPA: NUDIX hydrolase [Abditibacteriaceae bacterium]|jgi:8-oxo-dGTP pyrophosphatase MutT (NUDIX family)